MSGIRYLILFYNLIVIQLVFGQTFHDQKLNSYMSASEYRKSIKLAHSQINQLNNSDNEGLKRAYYLNQMGLAYFRLGIFDSAYLCGIQVLHSSTNTLDSAQIADNWKLMAYVYNRKGQFDSAIYYSDKMLNYATRKNDLVMKGNALTSLATILMQNKRYREALKYNTEAYSLFNKSLDYASIIVAEYNIGLAYLNLNKPDSSLLFLSRSLVTNKRILKKDIQPYIYDAIAECYFQKGDTFLWKEYLQKSKVAAEQSGNPHFVAIKLSQQGQQALIEGDLSKASEYLFDAHNTLSKLPFPALRMQVDSMLYIVSKKQGHFTDALQWLESYSTLKNQVLNTAQSEELNSMVLKLETHEKNIKLMEKEIEMRKMKEKLTLTLSGVFLLMLILTGILIYLFKVHSYQKVLYRKNIELDKQLRLSENIMEINATRFNEPSSESEEQDLSLQDESKNRKLELYRNLLQLVESQKLYLDPELNAKSTQIKLGTNKKYLYEAIAEFSGTNFRGLINRFRINEVRTKFEESIKNKRQVSLNEIAFNSGFNSYTSFFRVFKLQTGLTPNEYLSQLKKEKSVEDN